MVTMARLSLFGHIYTPPAMNTTPSERYDRYIELEFINDVKRFLKADKSGDANAALKSWCKAELRVLGPLPPVRTRLLNTLYQILERNPTPSTPST